MFFKLNNLVKYCNNTIVEELQEEFFLSLGMGIIEPKMNETGVKLCFKNKVNKIDKYTKGLSFNKASNGSCAPYLA